MHAPRIYWLTEEFPPETGGTGLVAASIAQGLARQALQIEVITRQTRPPQPRAEAFGPLRVRRIRPAGRLKGAGWRALPAMVIYLMRLVTLLAREVRRYDVVIVSCMKIIPLAAVPVCRLLGKRCIVRLESPAELVEPIANESLGSMSALLRRPLSWGLGVAQRAVLRSADHVVAISRDLESRLARTGCAPERILRIANPIDLERFTPVGDAEKVALRTRLQLPLDRTVALYAGRISRAKGILLLLDAWRELAVRHPRALLVLVGSGRGSWDDCEAEAERYVEAHGLQSHVQLAGPSDRVHEYMQAADFFVCPSDYEGFGLARAEALGCALPAVVTSVGIAPEVIASGENGFLVPPRDRGALIEAIATCLSQPERWSEMGRRARDSVAEFGLPQVIGQYATLCRELASWPGPAGPATLRRPSSRTGA